LTVATPVGGGMLPHTSSTTPDCPSLTVGPPAGVLVFGHKTLRTYIAPVIGISTLDINARAAAVSGYLQGSCDATQGEYCAVLPVAIPVNIVTCDGNNNPVNTQTAWNLYQVYQVPLCKNGPGNVGWLDWTPPSGGTSEVINSILHPDNPAINLPSWQGVTETGNPNAQAVEDAVNFYDGQTVLIPQFDATCSSSPDNSQISSAPNYGCPAGSLGGNGQNQWYRVASFAYFHLCDGGDADCLALGATQGAYINGNNSAICDSGNGATSCLVGRFVKILATGTVGPGVGGGTSNNKTIGVQLIK
jgi:hypothetical protein